jgi:Zn-dependent metalloprotease
VRSLRHVLSLALAGAALSAVPALQNPAVGQPAPSAAHRTIVDRMRSEASGTVQISRQRATGAVGFVRSAGGDLMPGRDGASRNAAAAKATAYVRTYAGAFGARPGELRQAGVTSDRYGRTVSFTQRYQGVPVFGARLLANLDRSGRLTSVNGYVAPHLRLSTKPAVSRAEAGRHAVALVRQQPPTDDKGKPGSTRGVKPASKRLVVYRTGFVKGDPGTSVLAYQVEVTNGANVRDMVFVDARTGKPVNRYSMATDALERHLKEAGGRTDPTTFVEVWKEGDAFPGTLTADQQREVLGTGMAYWFFRDTFGRDSYDAAGHSMTTVNNDGRINCPNANWNGITTNYCNGVTSDDVVAHEWGHAYTEYTSGLIYQWQPGALNESYSDVWGETIDLINYGRNDQGEGNLDAKRPDGICSAYTRGPVTATINAPAEVAGPCEAAAPASFGPVFTADGVTSDVVVGTDDAADGSPTNGCSAFTNAAAISGKWVYVDRGECVFTDKVAHAEDAGATGIVVGQNNPDEAPFSITDDSDIYGVMVAMADGTRIKSATGTVNMTVRDASETPGADSYRWLMGEKSPAFGGAIRDMWNPTCYGNAGKVSDAEYVCDLENDSGGVHQNSGIPNHAYALLVDGGDYNGVTVPGIGLDKAANIWWLTQTQHLTPTSDFTDFAEGLDASCQTLIGQEILGLETKRETPGTAVDPITPADCLAVAAVEDAVELRAEPTQCDFQPLLKKGSPAPCGKGTTSRKVWNEDFSDGLKGWSRNHHVAKGATGFPWRVRTNAPGHQGNQAAFAPDPLGSQCSDPSENFSSSNGITSPKVTLPSGAIVSSRLVFDHYVATEAGWDGGVVSVSVNGGKFKKVPGDAYMFNGYTGRLFNKQEGNSNPLRGMTAFTGTDGGVNRGSWGQSQVNLSKLHVERGDSVRIRFDFGRDSCMGLDGWYVDNVKVLVCKDKAGRREELATKR